MDHSGEAIERWLEAEREMLPVWLVVMFGAGIALWFALPSASAWTGVIALGLGLAFAGWPAAGTTRLGRSMLAGGLALALGCALVWWRAEQAATLRVTAPMMVSLEGTIERVEPRPAKGDVRLLVHPSDLSLPPRVRVTVRGAPEFRVDDRIRVRARLTPPPPMPLPGAHDFTRDSWFARIGGVGIAMGKVELIERGRDGGLDALRQRIATRIQGQLQGSQGGIATALATGDQAAVDEVDADAMRQSGLTHLLSVSGLHLAAVVGAAMLLALRLLALSQRLALRANLVLVAAGIAALTGIGYTVLTGSQVPTVRSCIAALLVLASIAIGREALSMRLIAVGAAAVLLFRPEALAGASFQFSFAAVTAIVAVHRWPWLRDRLRRRDEGFAARGARALLGLVATGLAVEIALMPIALYHFHRSGLYGVGANLIAIPWTTFVIMPLEGLALFLDTVGLGAPAWWLAGESIAFLLALAHAVASTPGAVTMLPTMSSSAYAAMMVGALWLALWQTRVRWLGLIATGFGAIAAASATPADLLVTGDGRHAAIVAPDGTPLLLREKSGDFVQSLFGESSGYEGDPGALADSPQARCNRDACVTDIVKGARRWRILALRGPDLLRWRPFIAACADADIVIAARRLPPQCAPRWLKLDRIALSKSGGVAIWLSGDRPRLDSVSARTAGHPWASPLSTLQTASSLPDGSMK